VFSVLPLPPSLVSSLHFWRLRWNLSLCIAVLPALDVHQAKLTVCMMYENELGEVLGETQEFGGFKKDREWVASFKPERVVMESTGIY
jgi:hypothetical protein